jgi:hypothetical protein
LTPLGEKEPFPDGNKLALKVEENVILRRIIRPPLSRRHWGSSRREKEHDLQ